MTVIANFKIAPKTTATFEVAVNQTRTTFATSDGSPRVTISIQTIPTSWVKVALSVAVTTIKMVKKISPQEATDPQELSVAQQLTGEVL